MDNEIRLARESDAEAIGAIYRAVLDRQEQGLYAIGWVRGVYPTMETVQSGIQNQDMYVLERAGRILAAARINQEQMPAYREVAWRQEASPSEVLVMHTLVSDPERGKGCGREMIAFYEALARRQGMKSLRIDTNEHNAHARSLYRSEGFEERGIIPTVFNGIEGVGLVCLEKVLSPGASLHR